MVLASRGLLLGCRLNIQSAVGTVVTHSGRIDVVVHHRRVVHIVNFRHVDIVHRTVVVEASAVPVAWSPQETNFRRQDPSSRDPIVVFVVRIPGPITWGPDVPLSWANWL